MLQNGMMQQLGDEVWAIRCLKVQGISQNSVIWEGVSYPPHPPTTYLVPLHLSKGVYLQNVVLKFSGSE